MNESELVEGLFANDTLFGNGTSVFDNLTLLSRDVEDVLLNPHLHPVSEVKGKFVLKILYQLKKLKAT